MHKEPEDPISCIICGNPIQYWESGCYKCIYEEPGDEHWLEPVKLN